VQYPVGLFLWGRRAVWVLSALAALSWPALLWDSAHGGVSLAVSAVFALVLAWALRRYQDRQCKVSGQLLWGEEGWCYLEDQQVLPVHHLMVLWDAGDRMWLRWRSMEPGGSQSWSEAWLLRRDAPERWHLLRCALAAHSGKNFTQPSHLA
jgi:hypothetical protein